MVQLITAASCFSSIITSLRLDTFAVDLEDGEDFFQENEDDDGVDVPPEEEGFEEKANSEFDEDEDFPVKGKPRSYLLMLI